MSTKIRKLPKRFERHGFSLKQMKRIADIAIYEAKYLGATSRSKIQGYIVAKIQREKEETLPSGTVLPAREDLPRKSKFGKYGWFYMPKSLETATTHFEELVAQVTQESPSLQKA